MKDENKRRLGSFADQIDDLCANIINGENEYCSQTHNNSHLCLCVYLKQLNIFFFIFLSVLKSIKHDKHS